jgi:hypothetical protein
MSQNIGNHLHSDVSEAESNLLAIILTDLAVVLQEIELYSSSRAKQTNTRLRTLKETVLPAI